MKFFKIIFLLISIVLLQNCQNISDDNFQKKETLPYRLTKIDPSQNKFNNLIESYLTSDNLENGRSNHPNHGEIDRKNAYKVENLIDGTSRYTFRIINEDPLVTENLIIREDIKGNLFGYIISYKSKSEWSLSDNMNVKDFTGEVIFSTFNNQPFYKIDLVNGKGNLFRNGKYEIKNGRIACEGSGGSSGGGGGSGNVGDWNWSGWGEFGTLENSSGGGDGSGIIIIYIDPPEKDETDDITARLACDPPEFSDKVVCNGDDALVSECVEMIPIAALTKPGYLCDNIKFTHIQNGFTAEIDGLGLTAINELYNIAIHADLGTVCVTIPEYGLSNKYQASTFFVNAFNESRIEIFYLLNLEQLEPNSFAIRKKLIELMNQKLTSEHPGSKLNLGPCSGNIESTNADYGC